jgi:hypothetical protein
MITQSLGMLVDLRSSPRSPVKVKDAMHRVSPDTPVIELAKLMREPLSGVRVASQQ